MGLLLGASALTIGEILDFFIYNFINKLFVRRRNYRVNENLSAITPTNGSIEANKQSEDFNKSQAFRNNMLTGAGGGAGGGGAENGGSYGKHYAI